MRILHAIGTLDPTYGGPVEVLRQQTLSIQSLGCETETVTLDAPGEYWLGGFPGMVYALGPSRGKYRYCARLAPWLRAHGGNYDAVIVHGIWQYQSLAVRSAANDIGLPYFVFVHGALDPWFKRHYPLKHLKKLLYWPWADYRVLRDAAAVFFTCEEERCLARKSFHLYRANEVVVGFGIAPPPGDPCEQREAFLAAHSSLRDKRILLFLSRIHPKKGCDLLIEAMAEVGCRDEKLHLVMAGPDQQGWRAQLMSAAESRGVADRITWTGMLTGDVKWGAYRAADAFVLPSHSENFGIVVPEALACGVPVLISNKVNIWREIELAGAGLVEEDTLSGTTALLERWLSMPTAEAERMRARTRGCFAAHFEIGQAARELVAAIERIRAAGAVQEARPSRRGSIEGRAW